MSYSMAIVSGTLFVFGIILLLFPDYSQKKFFKNNKDIRIVGVIVLCIAILLAIIDMRSVTFFSLLEDIYKGFEK